MGSDEGDTVDLGGQGVRQHASLVDRQRGPQHGAALERCVALQRWAHASLGERPPGWTGKPGGGQADKPVGVPCAMGS